MKGDKSKRRPTVRCTAQPLAVDEPGRTEIVSFQLTSDYFAVWQDHDNLRVSQIDGIGRVRHLFCTTLPEGSLEPDFAASLPLFPELRPHLERVFDAAAEGATFVITRYRDTSSNLRTQMLRLIARAGLQPWPRVWQNLRSSRETDLADRFPLHVVTAWLGNTPRVAEQHYLQVKPERIAEALRVVQTGGARSDRNQHNRAPSVAPPMQNSPGNSLFPEEYVNCQYPRVDSNRGEFSEKYAPGDPGAAFSGAVAAALQRTTAEKPATDQALRELARLLKTQLPAKQVNQLICMLLAEDG